MQLPSLAINCCMAFSFNRVLCCGQLHSTPFQRRTPSPQCLVAAMLRCATTKAMTDLGDTEFERFWRRLQQLGLNAYEARSYLVLIGHQRFKALELAARAHVPRQKIYEVLDSLVEK